MTSETSTNSKSTLVPLPYANSGLSLTSPYSIGDSITVENVQDLLKEEHFIVTM